VEIAHGASLSEIACPTCNSTFNLLGEPAADGQAAEARVSQSSALLAGAPGARQLRSQLLSRARDYYAESIADERTPQSAMESARANMRLGNILREMGRVDDARTTLAKAIAVFCLLCGGRRVTVIYSRS
jgi:hypothetical protein